jgi:hypothetical protein
VGWLWQVSSVQFTQILQKTSSEKFYRRAREAPKSAALKPQIMTPQGPIYRPFTMQDEPIKEWRCRATLTKLNRKPKRRSTTRGSALVDEATGGSRHDPGPRLQCGYLECLLSTGTRWWTTAPSKTEANIRNERTSTGLLLGVQQRRTISG